MSSWADAEKTATFSTRKKTTLADQLDGLRDGMTAGPVSDLLGSISGSAITAGVQTLIQGGNPALAVGNMVVGQLAGAAMNSALGALDIGEGATDAAAGAVDGPTDAAGGPAAASVTPIPASSFASFFGKSPKLTMHGLPVALCTLGDATLPTGGTEVVDSAAGTLAKGGKSTA